MKKKQRCFVKRFAALVAALVISLSLPVLALAASDTEADMPSLSDFYSHSGSWFVWRIIDIPNLGSFFELTGDPIFVSGSGYSLPSARSYSTNAFDVTVDFSQGDSFEYGCAYPSPLVSSTGSWSSLPSFPVGVDLYLYHARGVRCYTVSPSSFDGVVYGFLISAFSSSDKIVSNSYLGSSGSPSSLDVASFYSPLAAYPFAYRSFSSSVRSGFSLRGGDNAFLTSPSGSVGRVLNLDSARLLCGSSSFVSYPSTFSVPSSSLGVVFAKPPSSSYLITDSSDYNVSFSCVFTLIVPVGLLPDVKVGDWISDSPEDLQDSITNEFGVDSGTLKNSKDNLNSWNSTSSIDTDVANTSLSTINALFQNLGQFLAIVSLMVFGAVVLRMLVRKAVDG